MQVAEASAAAGGFIHRQDEDKQGVLIHSLHDYAVIMPTMIAVHEQGSWRAKHVSDQYADNSAKPWDVRTIV